MHKQSTRFDPSQFISYITTNSKKVAHKKPQNNVVRYWSKLINNANIELNQHNNVNDVDDTDETAFINWTVDLAYKQGNLIVLIGVQAALSIFVRLYSTL